MIASWAGFRGGVSLAAALAIPATVASGADFPRRQLTIFLTFGVIFVTLVGQGMTLPWLIAKLRLPEDRYERAAMRSARARIARVALERLKILKRAGEAEPATLELLRHEYESRRRIFGHPSQRSVVHDSFGYEAAVRDLVAVQRQELIAMRARGDIDGTTLADVEALLDAEEIGLDR